MPTLFHTPREQAFKLTGVRKIYSPQLTSGRDKQVSRAPLLPTMNAHRIHFMICLSAPSELFPPQIFPPPPSGLVFLAKF